MTPDEIADHLHRHILFADCTKRQLKDLARHCSIVQVEPGSDLVVEGAPATEAYLLLAGELDVIHQGEAIAHLGPGDFVGELGVINRRVRRATVRATTPVEAVALSRESLKQAVEEIDGFAWSLLATVAHRLEEAEDR
jgi:CRP/FNR family cyclic AMP-dependent transcriptional regulator